MFGDDQSINYQQVNNHVNLFSSTFKQNIIEQAASMLVQHVTFNKHTSRIAQNSNGNAFDEYHLSLNHIQRKKKDVRRTKKCNSWLSNLPTKSDTSLNRLPILVQSSSNRYDSNEYSPSIHFYPSIEHSNVTMNKSHRIPSRLHRNQLTLSANATSDINPNFESFAPPLIMVHKKRLRRDNFLSTMQNCLQPPYSPNHFYAFDQLNMLKLQRNLHSIDWEKQDRQRNKSIHSKRKYAEDDYDEPECVCSETQLDRSSPSKKYFASPIEHSSPKTADHMNIHKYHHAQESSLVFEEKLDIEASIQQQQTSEPSHAILSHLEKILNLCGELRSLAKDVEVHLNEQTVSKTSPIEMNEKDPIKESESEQTLIDIYKELENQQISTDDHNEKNAPPPYQQTNDTSSIHSGSNQSIQLMQTESFKTKSPSLSTSHTKLRTSEDICSCFLKSFLENQNCELNPDEQEYLNELTKAYVLGREQILEEQQEANNKFQAFLNETLPEESDDPSSFIYDTNNNNQAAVVNNPSSVLIENNYSKLNDRHSSMPVETKNSMVSLVQDGRQQSSIPCANITVKHQLFLDEPIAMKTTNALPGIGMKYAQQLSECGFSTVRRLLGFYLMIKDDQHFVIWLNNQAGISIHSAWLCTNALRAWCQAHL